MVLNTKDPYCGFPYIKIVDFIKEKKNEMKKNEVLIIKRMNGTF